MDKTRVLVVDDELDTLNLLKMLLEISGFEPISTLNSVEAIALAELEKPDVILLDIMMPKLDGFALCKMMRQHPELKTRPIIFVTAYDALDLEERKVDAGADAVVNKPINMDKLTATIADVHATRQAAKANPQKAIEKAPPAAVEPKAEVKPPAVIEEKHKEIIPAETDKPKAIQPAAEVPSMPSPPKPPTPASEAKHAPATPQAPTKTEVSDEAPKSPKPPTTSSEK